MALRFDPQEGFYDAGNETVRFYAYDGETRLTFAITRVALEDLTGISDLDADACRSIFQEQRNFIEGKAADLWRAIKADHSRQGTAPSTVDPIIIPTIEY